jgi:membrane-bound lytic murein transglycosylase B
LLEALQIVDEGHIAPQEMVGSWAGAMGQSQFMPSSFRRFAIDYNGDGRRDIWKSLPDVFASIANYLSSSGWHEDETWGRQVSLPAGFDYTLSQSDVVKPLADWQALGVRRDDGRDLPVASLDASLVLPNGTDPPVFLVYNNYRVLLTWNRSHYFATTVSQFADRLAEY